MCDFWFHLSLQVSKHKIHKWLVSVNSNMSDQDYQKVQQKAEECFQKWCEKDFIDTGNSNCAAVVCLHLCVSSSLWFFFKLSFYFIDLVDFFIPSNLCSPGWLEKKYLWQFFLQNMLHRARFMTVSCATETLSLKLMTESLNKSFIELIVLNYFFMNQNFTSQTKKPLLF